MKEEKGKLQLVGATIFTLWWNVQTGASELHFRSQPPTARSGADSLLM